MLPLRARITVVFAAGMVAVLAALGAFVYARTGADLLAQVDAGLRSRAEVLTSEVGPSGPTIVRVSHLLIERDEAFAQVVDASGEVVDSSAILGSRPLLDAGTIRSVDRAAFFDRRVPGIDDVTRILAIPVSHGGSRYVLLVGASLQDRRDQLLQLGATLAIAGPVALALIALAGWLAIGAALRPVERMRGEADAISALEPERRLAVPSGDDELTRLASTLNGMLGRLQEAFDRERRFVDDASHELRTPLGILRARLEHTLARPRTTEELEDALRRSLAETERMSRLADDLLVLARSNRGRIPIHREEVALGDLVEEVAGLHDAGARALGVRLEAEPSDGVVRVDPVRVRQVLENLLDNAIRLTGSGGTVRIRSSRADGVARIEVEDSGPGFPARLLPVAFEPFTRDPAERNGAGAGLGLAIVRAVALAHGGTVSAENRPEGGARVTVTLRAG